MRVLLAEDEKPLARAIVKIFEKLCVFLWCKQEGKPHKYGQEENSRKSTRCCEIYI